MKVIITGGTGFIGSAALKRLLALPTVTSVIALSRREIPIKDPKLETIIIKDFKTCYTPDLLDQLSGAEACIWALGKPTSGKEVHVEYTFAAAKAFRESLIPKLPAGKSFHFIYVSGGAIVADQSKTLWFLSDIRKARGVVENTLCDEYDGGNERWKTFVARPGLVTRGKPIFTMVMKEDWFIPVEELGAALVELAVEGKWEGGKQRVECGELRRVGQGALEL